MPSAHFFRANEIGKEAELYVADLLSERGYRVVKAPESYFPEYDLLIESPRGRWTVEIKNDTKANTTGNIYLDLNSLHRSSSDILAYVVSKTVYFCDRKKVLDLGLNWHSKIHAGEFREEAALIPRSIFIDRIKPKILTADP